MPTIFFQNKKEIVPGVFELSFLVENFSFKPGQFIDIILPKSITDSRSNHREFSILSTPTDLPVIKTAFKYSPSEFKKYLLNLKPNEVVSFVGPYGDFVLSKNSPTCFIAGGIGITPIVSLVSEAKDKDRVTVIYNDSTARFPYQETLTEKNIKLITTTERINEKIITENDLKPNTNFYIAGPVMMVVKTKQTLENLGFASENIFTDEFVGY